MIYHMHASVDGLLNMRKKESDRVLNYTLTDDNGNYLPAGAARKQLQLLQGRGIKLIASSGCDNFDPETGCKGHEEKAEEAA